MGWLRRGRDLEGGADDGYTIWELWGSEDTATTSAAGEGPGQRSDSGQPAGGERDPVPPSKAGEEGASGSPAVRPDPATEAELEGTRVELEQARAELAQARAELEELSEEVKRLGEVAAEPLSDRGNALAAEVDARDLETMEQEIEQLVRDVEDSRSEAERARRDLDSEQRRRQELEELLEAGGRSSGDGGGQANHGGEAVTLWNASFEDLRSLGLSTSQTARTLQLRIDGAFEGVDDPLEQIPGLPRALREELRGKLSWP